MKKWFGFLCLLVFVLALQGSASALVTQDLDPLSGNKTAQELADTVFGAGGATVSATAVHTGDLTAAGLFSGGIADGLGIEEGVILSSGDIHNAEITPNNEPLISTSFNLAGDADVSAVLQGKVTRDASVLEFDFIPNPDQNVVDFNFVFASDEYNENTDGGGIYGNDAFVLLVDGVHFALVPGTTTPVSIDAINKNTNLLFFIDNDYISDPPPVAPQFDGFTTVLTSRVIVTPGQSHHIKIAIADDAGTFDPADPLGLDDFVDSAVFLAPAVVQSLPVNTIGLFKSGEWNLDLNGNMAWDGTAVDRVNTFGIGLAGDIPVPGDYDGDEKADLAIWRPSDGNWWVIRSSDGVLAATSWGAPGDIPVPGDYDGDEKADLAIWRPSDGNWWVIRSSDGVTTATAWGAPGDIAVPGDYDGDGKTDLAVWRPSDGNWWVIRSSDGVTVAIPWGAPSDKPVPGDYDGDGKTDRAVWRPSDGNWWVIRSSDGVTVAIPWGAPSDKPVPGDYDGDGKTDRAVWRPSDGNWWIIRSSDAVTTATSWGMYNTLPVTGDWNNSGKTETGVFQDGMWYLDMNGNGVWDGELTDMKTAFRADLPGAIPVTGDWDGSGSTSIGVYKDGIWYLDMNGNGIWDGGDRTVVFNAGQTNATPVTGNWAGGPATNIGVYKDGIWYLDMDRDGIWDGEPTDKIVAFRADLPGAIPVTGDWNGSGSKKIGVFLDGTWYLDYNGNGAWDGGVTDRQSVFGAGLTGVVPVSGKWN
ncbi:MAG: choice-of-anchor L domain-containing protein [Thermodesulfovibrionales bacterium]